MDNRNIKLSLRKVIHSHKNLLLNWANDPVVRKGSFQNHMITEDEHEKWFDSKLNNPNVLMWIFTYNGSPAGTIRFEKDKKEVILSYQIAPNYRGKGLGTDMLKMAIERVEYNWHHSNKIMAYTVPGNIASVKSMEKVGFCLESSSNEKIVMYYLIPKN